MTAAPKRSSVPAHGPTTPETELVDAARNGEEAAIRELIRRLNRRLFRVARGIVASDAEAEEVVQECYLAAFTRLDGFDGRAQFSTWITRIAINAAMMQVRRARPQQGYDTVTEDHFAHILSFPGQSPESPEASLGRSQMRGLLDAAVADLPPDLRLVFLLHETEGMKTRDIARDLSLNPITVKTRLFRARRRLRAALEHRIQGGFGAIFPFDGARCANLADRVVARLEAQRPLPALHEPRKARRGGAGASG